MPNTQREVFDEKQSLRTERCLLNREAKFRKEWKIILI